MTETKRCPKCNHKALYWRKTYNGYKCNFCHVVYDKNFIEIPEGMIIERIMSTFNRICIDCKEPFVAVQQSINRCPMCRKIKNEEHANPKTYDKVCLDCKKHFVTTHNLYIRCSSCVKVKKEKDKNRKKKTYNIICKVCKEPFIAHHNFTTTCDSCKSMKR